MSVTVENSFGNAEITLRLGVVTNAVFVTATVFGEEDAVEHDLGMFYVRDLLAATLAFTPKRAPRRFLSLKRSKRA